jgi:DNA segregation ATPase FtsK/SpoIIIE-like protein
MVTLYRLRPEGRTRASHVAAIAEDLALVLCVDSVYVQQLPSEGAIGIYIPRPGARPAQ